MAEKELIPKGKQELEGEEQVVGADLELAALEFGPRRLQVRRRVPGMSGHGHQRQPVRPRPAIELEGEEQVGELRLPVGRPLAVSALPVEIVPPHPPHAMCTGRGRHHTRTVALGEQRQQPAGQREVTEVIRSELGLEAVNSAAQR